MNQTIRRDELCHYGVKGMRWGIVNEDAPVQTTSSQKTVNLKKPSVSEVQKNTPRPSQNADVLTRTRQEIRDDRANRIGNFDDILRFDPTTESIEDATASINEGYGYSEYVDDVLASEEINPDWFNKEGELKTFNNNCPSAAIAYDLRRRGYNVEAGITGGYRIADILKVYGINGISANLRGMAADPKDRTAEIEKMGPGARGVCLMTWKNGGGHISSFEVDAKGKVVYIDAQTGKTSRDKNIPDAHNPALYYKDASKYFVVRTDDKKINKKLVKDFVRHDDGISPKAVQKHRFIGPVASPTKKKQALGPPTPVKKTDKTSQTQPEKVKTFFDKVKKTKLPQKGDMKKMKVKFDKKFKNFMDNAFTTTTKITIY